MTNPFYKSIAETSVALIVAYLLFVLLMFVIQRNYIYFPDKTRPSRAIVNAGFMDVIEVQTADGLTLEGWYSPPEKGKPVILYFHGNAGNIAMRAPVIRPFVDQGYGVLLAEYRGYGGNPGKPTEQGLYDDGRAYIEWLVNQAGVSVRDIVLYGVSLGSGVAVKMANEYKEVASLILVTPFTSLAALGQKHMFYLPVFLLIRDRYDNMSRIEGVRAPILVLHGQHDNIVPLSFGRELYKSAPEPKKFVVFDNGNHNNLYARGLQEEVIAFLKNLDQFKINSNKN